MEYTFKNKKTGKIVTHDIKISEYDEFKKNNPHLERYLESPPAVAYNGKTFTSGTDNTWKEVLSKIGQQNPASPLAEQYYRRSNKEVKSKNIVDKHKEKVKKLANSKQR